MAFSHISEAVIPLPKNHNQVDRSVLLLLLLLLEIRNRIVPTGSTPEGGPTEVSPTTQATRHPRALFTSLFPLPPYYCHASCIRSVPPPVLPSCTYILPSLWSVSSLSSCLTHIFNPTKGEPLNKSQTPHTNCINLLYQ